MSIELRRYTDYTKTISILSEKNIELKDQQRWDDQNDIFTINKYKEIFGYKTVLTMCFAHATEKYLLWKSYMHAEKKDGICIVFDEDYLHEAINLCCPEIIFKPITYVRMNEKIRIQPEDLPFIKRLAYQGEDEYRIIYSSKSGTINQYKIPITRNCIKRIIVNPWVNENKFKEYEHEIHHLSGWEDLKIMPSTVLFYKNWVKYIESHLIK